MRDSPKLAYLFPGQGAQKVGMGKSLAEHYPVSRAVFEEVDDALNMNLSRIVWHGDIQELTRTEHAQPALMATSIAALRALEQEGFRTVNTFCLAGHSLGEYSALCAAKAIKLKDTAKLLQLRGRAMQAAVPNGRGAMAAIIGLEPSIVQSVARDAANGLVCEVANDNSPGQIVVSGDVEAVDRAIEIASVRGARRTVKLQVSAPFHCSLMKVASDAVAEALAETEISSPLVPILSNVTAQPMTKPEQIKSLLERQVTGTVRWREIVLWMAKNGVKKAWEVGAGNTLTGLVRRTQRVFSCSPVGSSQQVVDLVKKLEEEY